VELVREAIPAEYTASAQAAKPSHPKRLAKEKAKIKARKKNLKGEACSQSGPDHRNK